MEKVTGIGGLFFRSSKTGELAAWYRDNLGVDMGDSCWSQQAGPTVFAPFERGSDYFPKNNEWMINFRVENLDAMIHQLESNGIDIQTKSEWDSEVGKFARIHDPEGNPIELWQPNWDFAVGSDNKSQ